MLHAKGCFFAACQNGNSSHLFGNVLSDNQRGGNPVLFPTGVLEDVETLGLHDGIRMAANDRVF